MTESQKLRVKGLAREIAHMETEQLLAPNGELEKVYLEGQVDYTRMTKRAKKQYVEFREIWEKRLAELIEVS